MSRKPLLFLDVDGVLHPLRLEFKDGKVIDDHCFKPSCMAELKRVVDTTGAEIVLSSSWRLYEGPKEQLRKALLPYGLSFTRSTTSSLEYGGTRASQILHFLDHVEQAAGEWAVVDDESVFRGSEPESLMEQVVGARLVRTDERVGLARAGADQLIALLQGEEGEEGGEGEDRPGCSQVMA